MKKGERYAYLVLLGCCIMQGCSMGIVFNSAGVYFTPICEELKFSMAGLSFYKTLAAFAGAIASPIAARAISTRDVRVVLTSAAVLMAASTGAMGFFTQVWQWYVAGVLQTAGATFLAMLPATMILRNWFPANAGAMIGVSASFGGLFGMVANWLLGLLIPVFGWRVCYWLTGGVLLLLIVPITLFVIRYQPSDVGMMHVGAEKGKQDKPLVIEEPTVDLRTLLRTPSFFTVVLLSLCISYACGFSTFVPAYGINVGLTISAASLLASCSLAGNMTCKLVIGGISDRFGSRNALLGGCAAALTGYACLLLAEPRLLYPGAFLYGITLPLGSVMVPLTVAECWKGADYGVVYGYILSITGILACPSSTLFGLLYDNTGKYVAGLAICSVLILVAAGLGWQFYRREKEPSAIPGKATEILATDSDADV